jgi:hypothetical protein
VYVEGTAAAVDLRGEDSAVLAAQEPFNHGRVRLFPVKIGGVSPVAELTRIVQLSPVLQTRPGTKLEVSYAFGSPVTILVKAGGEKGMFIGTLEGAPQCEKGWCELAWQPPAEKRIELWYDGPRGAVNEARLLGKLPNVGTLSQIVLHGAKGTVACDDGVHPSTGELVFDGHAITLQHLYIGVDGFAVRLVDGAPPHAPQSGAWLAAPAIVGVAALAAGVMHWRRKAAKSANVAPAQSEAVASWDLFLAHAGDDTAPAEELYTRLAGKRRVFLDKHCVRLGDDWDLAIARAQQAARVTVVLVSARYPRAYYLREEIAAAIAMARKDSEAYRVVPVFLDGWPAEPSGIPYGLLLKNGVDARAAGGMSGVAAALEKLLAQLDGTSPPPAEPSPPLTP